MLYHALKGSLPQSCFVEMMEGKRKRHSQDESKDIPQGVKQIAENFIINKNISEEENIISFTENIKITSEQINTIENATRTQSDNDQWYQQRAGRITASNLYRICTRVATLQKSENANADNLLYSLLYAKHIDTYATRHGKATEPHAKRAVVQVLKNMQHKNVKSEDRGTIICEEIPYLSASPDLYVTCSLWRRISRNQVPIYNKR